MKYLISYDVSNNNLRLKASKAIQRAGCYRIQYSVFMGTLRQSTMKRLTKELIALQKHSNWKPEDSLLVLPLHQYSLDELTHLGKMPDEWEFIQQNIHTLVL